MQGESLRNQLGGRRLREDIELLDGGLLEQLTCVLTKRFRDVTRQVGLAAVVVVESVEEAGLSIVEGEPKSVR